MGKWFPEDPNNAHSQMKDIPEHDNNNDRIMGIPNKDCDDGQVSLIHNRM